MQSSHRRTVFADYFQFILMDPESDDDFSTLWDPAALERMVAAGTSAASFGTLRNVDVEVEVHVVEELPVPELGRVDHAATGSLRVASGVLALLGCTDALEGAYEIAMPAGSWQFLYLVSGVDTIVEESSPANELYTVYLAPGERPPALLKHWRPK